jgi:O-acetylserine/cysteine efflux transporter
MSVREALVLLMICTIWGLHFSVMKTVVAAGIPPLIYAAIRMALVAVVMSPWLRWHPGQMKWVAIAGVGYGALAYAFMFPALMFTTASAAAVAIELYVPFSVILGFIVLKDRPGWRRICGIALALAGVGVIAMAKPDEGVAQNHILGLSLIACGAFCEAIAALSVKKVQGVSPKQLLAWFAVIGTLILFPLSWVFEDDAISKARAHPNLLFWALLYTAFGASILAHGSYYWLLQRLPISVVAPSGLLTTVIAVIGAVALLGEELTLALAGGMLLVLIGVGIVLWRQSSIRADDMMPET